MALFECYDSTVRNRWMNCSHSSIRSQYAACARIAGRQQRERSLADKGGIVCLGALLTPMSEELHVRLACFRLSRLKGHKTNCWGHSVTVQELAVKAAHHITYHTKTNALIGGMARLMLPPMYQASIVVSIPLLPQQHPSRLGFIRGRWNLIKSIEARHL